MKSKARVFILLIGSFNCLLAQNEHIISSDDTAIVKKINNLFYDLNDSLPDGIYIMYDDEDNIILKCNYKEGKREGVYFRSFVTGAKLIYIINYSSGMKYGSEQKYFVFSRGGIQYVYHAEYKYGKKDGFEIFYESSNGAVKKIHLFNNDTLIKVVQYTYVFEDVQNVIYELNINSEDSFTFSKHFYSPNRVINLYVQEFSIRKYEVYDSNGNIVLNSNINIAIESFDVYNEIPNILILLPVEALQSENELLKYFSENF
jgi:hypothetical protein